MDTNEIIELLKSSINYPFVSITIYALNQIVKQTSFPNKYLMPLTFAWGMIAAIIVNGADGTLFFDTSKSVFSLIKEMFVYGAGTMILQNIIHKIIPSIGQKSDDISETIVNKISKTKDGE